MGFNLSPQDKDRLAQNLYPDQLHGHVGRIEQIAAKIPGYEGSKWQAELGHVKWAAAKAAMVAEAIAFVVDLPLIPEGIGIIGEAAGPFIALGVGAWVYFKGKKRVREQMEAAANESLRRPGTTSPNAYPNAASYGGLTIDATSQSGQPTSAPQPLPPGNNFDTKTGKPLNEAAARIHAARHLRNQ